MTQWKSGILGDDRDGPGKHVLVIGKAVAILGAFLEGPDEMSLSQIGGRVGLGPSTCHRIVATLEYHRLLERSPGGRYRLGLRLFQLGSLVQLPQTLARIADPIMRTLADRMAIGAFLSIEDESRAVCIARVDRGQVILAPYRVGETLPLHVGAAPLILLAGLPDAEVDQILTKPPEALTARTVTDRGVIRQRVQDVRVKGYAVAIEGDLALGLSAVGAPIRDPFGQVVAAISLSGLSSHVHADEQAMVSAVVEAASAISAALAHGDVRALAAEG